MSDTRTFLLDLGTLKLEIIATEVADGKTSFKIICLEGKADINALYFSNGDSDGTIFDLGKSLNMNGSGEDWDYGVKVSDTGLGKAGETKSSYLSYVGDVVEINNVCIDIDTIATLGIRATSTSTPEGSIKGVVDYCPPPPKACPVLFEENFDNYGADVQQTYEDPIGNPVFASVNLQPTGGWTTNGVSELGANGYGTIETTSGGFWFDTQNSPGKVEISKGFSDASAAVNGKTAILSFDVAVQNLDYLGKHYETDPNASFEFKIDGVTVAHISVADVYAKTLGLANNMAHFDIAISGYTGAGNSHTLTLVDTSANPGFTGFAVDSIKITDVCGPNVPTYHAGNSLFSEDFESYVNVDGSNVVNPGGTYEVVLANLASKGWTGDVAPSIELGGPNYGGVLGVNSHWLDTQSTVDGVEGLSDTGQVNIAHQFTDVNGGSIKLSFDIGKQEYNSQYVTDPNATFEFRIDGNAVAAITAQQLATNQMSHFDVVVNGLSAGAHTLELVDTTDVSSNVGFAVDNILVQDWLI